MASIEIIETAIRAKKEKFLAQKETLSIKHVRRIIEQDLGLEKKSLDKQKDVVAELVDKIMFEDPAEDAGRITKQQQNAAAKPKAPAPKQAANGSKQRARQDPVGMDGHTKDAAISKNRGNNTSAPAKPAKKRKKSAADSDDTAAGSDSGIEAAPKKAKARKPAATAAAPAGSKHGPRVQKLQRICRGAGISIPPSMYKKNPDPQSLEEALESLLAKHQLSANSDAQAVAGVKAKLELQRDMEGIDLSNIIHDEHSGRGRRPRRAAAQVDFKRILKQDTDDDDEDGGEEDVEESDSGSELSAGDSDDDGVSKRSRPKAQASSKRQKGPQRKRKAASSDSGGGNEIVSESEGGVLNSVSDAQDTDEEEHLKQQNRQVKQPRQDASKPAAMQQRNPVKPKGRVVSDDGLLMSAEENMQESNVEKSLRNQQPGIKAAQKSAAKKPIVLDDDDGDDDDDGGGSVGPVKTPEAARASVQRSAAKNQPGSPAAVEQCQQQQTSSSVEEELADPIEASEGGGQQQLAAAAAASKCTMKKAVVSSSDDEAITEQQKDEEYHEELGQEREEEEESEFEAVEDDD